MFTIKWNGDHTKYSVTFCDGWSRLNSCNAATYKRSEWSSDNALNKEIKTETFYLVSYGTPIMYVQRRYYMGSGKIIDTNIYVNEIQWNCSRTTVQHISRFCRSLEHTYGIDVSYYDIKEDMLSTNLHYGFSMAIKERMQVVRMKPHDMKAVFDSECPNFFGGAI